MVLSLSPRWPNVRPRRHKTRNWLGEFVGSAPQCLCQPTALKGTGKCEGSGGSGR